MHSLDNSLALTARQYRDHHQCAAPSVAFKAGTETQGELLASSQAKVVELHGTLTRHAGHAGVSDEQLLVSNARLQSDLESSMQRSQEYEG